MKSFYISVLILVLLALNVNGAIYVSQSGSNSNPGTENSPFGTIEHAVAVASAGDTVFIFTGFYQPATDITIDKPLTIMKYGIGNTVIDADNRTAMPDKSMFRIVNTHDVNIIGISFQYCTGIDSKAIYVYGSGDKIKIDQCSMLEIGWVRNLTDLPASGSVVANAIFVKGSSSTPITNLEITNCTVRKCGLGYGEAISVTGNVDGFLIGYNTLDSLSNIAIGVSGNYSYANSDASVNQARNGRIIFNTVSNCMSGIHASAGIYIDGAYNCTIENNLLHHNAVGIAVNAEQPSGTGSHTVSNFHIFGNVIHSNVVSGMMIGSSNLNTYISNAYVYNNTFFHNRTGRSINDLWNTDGQDSTTYGNSWGGELHLKNCGGVEFMNNIVFAESSKSNIVVLNGFTINNFLSDYNLYYRDNGTTDFNVNNGTSLNNLPNTGNFPLSSFASTFSLESHSISLNPNFANQGQLNFSLINSSPCLEAGNPNYQQMNSGSIDMAGNSRLFNARIDIGAYEYIGFPLSLSSTEEKNDVISLYPNPASNVIRIKTDMEIEKIDILSITGQLLIEHRPVNKQVDISHLPAGSYLLHYYGVDGETNFVKFVKI